MFGKSKNNKKLGLALGGGGAKGAVHLGVLRAFEEEGVRFDVVAGTSIGSIIGGLYAKGYGWREIESVIMGGGVNDVAAMFIKRVAGSGVDEMIGEIVGKTDFSDLKLPFAAVAVDLDSGEEKVFTQGDVATCMGASSAIAPYFRAVTIDGRRYVDGAYRNIIPCDAARALGCDKVVGVDLSCGRRSTANGKKILDEMYPSNGIPVCNPTQKGYSACDYMIAPDLAAFTSTDFRNMGEMFDIGYFSAKEAMPALLAAIK